MQTEQLNEIFIVLSISGVLIILSLIFLFGIFINRKNSLVTSQYEAKLKNQKKQHELELKALRGQMNPHFIHNSLNAIQYYIQQNDVEASEIYLAKFSKLMRQFFDFSRQANISIHDEISLLENYLSIEKLRFEDNLKYSITLDPNIDALDENIPSMILQPLVENAINHGLFHKKGIGTISILFGYVDENCYTVTITDNGIGINKARAIEKNIHKEGESHSSEVLAERLHYLKESSMWDVEFSITDRSATENTSGTKVLLTFKRSIRNEN